MKIFQKTFIVSIGQFASSMERIVVFMILSRTLSKYDYGTYQQVWLVYTLVSPIFMLGLPSSVLYFIPRNERQKHKTIVYQSLLLLEVVGIIFSAVTIITAPIVATQFHNPDLITYLRVFALYPLVSLPPKLVNLLMIADEKPVTSVIVSVIYTIVIVTSITGPSIIGLPLIYTFYGAVVGGAIFFVGVVIFLNQYYQGQKVQWDWKLMREILIYSIPLGLSSILGTISTQLNKLIVSSTFSPDTYAAFSNGAFEIPFIGLITGSLMTVLIPEFVNKLKNHEGANSVWVLWNGSTIKTASLLFPIAVSLFVFASDFMVVMFSSKYVNSTEVFRIYLFLTILRVTQYSSLLLAMGKTKLILYTSIIGLFMNLVFSVIFVSVFGLVGPAWANVLTTYSWGFIYLVMICRLWGIRFSAVMPWKTLGKLFAVAVASGVLPSAILFLNMNALPRIMLGMVTYFLIYVSILLLIKFITIKDVVQVTNFYGEKLRYLYSKV